MFQRFAFVLHIPFSVPFYFHAFVLIGYCWRSEIKVVIEFKIVNSTYVLVGCTAYRRIFAKMLIVFRLMVGLLFKMLP